MAAAKATQVPVTNTTDGISIDLSVAEAQTLFMVLSMVGGDPEMSRRSQVDTIREAIRGVLNDYDEYIVPTMEQQRTVLTGGLLYFRDEVGYDQPILHPDSILNVRPRD